MQRLIVFHAGVDLDLIPYSHINLLLNPFDHGYSEHTLAETRKFIEIVKPEFVMLDSGGNSIFNAEKRGLQITHDSGSPLHNKNRVNISPKHVVEIARKLQPTILVALDLPLQKVPKEEEGKEFRKKLPQNIKFAKETISLIEDCPETNVLIPVQARNVDQLEIFLSGLNGMKFSGVCIPIRNVTPKKLVLYLTRLYQLNVKWVHLLGTTCFTVSGIAAYFARNKYFEIVSLDSRTCQTAAQNSIYLSPHDLRCHKINDQMVIPAVFKNDCNCPFCRGLSFQEMADVMSFDQRRNSLIGHNTWVTEKVIQDLYRNAKSLSQLREFMICKSRNYRKVVNAMKALELFETMKNEKFYLIKSVLE